MDDAIARMTITTTISMRVKPLDKGSRIRGFMGTSDFLKGLITL
jgi:hypothetical protein